jgi:hypothetical protein
VFFLVSPEVPRPLRVRFTVGFPYVPLPSANAAPATRKHSDPTVKVTMSRISTPLAAAAPGTHQTAKNRPASRCLGSIAMNAPNAIAARLGSNRRSPMVVNMRLTRLYYRTRAPFNKPLPFVVRILDQRSTPAHLAPVSLHSGEELLPGTGGALEAVAVQGEFVDELVQGRVGVGYAAGVRDDEDLPFLELLDVVYRGLETGAMVEEVAPGFEILVSGDQLVASFGGVCLYSGLLLPGSGELALRVGPDVRGRARHAPR